MSKKLISFILVLAFCLASSLQAGTIIWVSDDKNPTGGVPADQGYFNDVKLPSFLPKTNISRQFKCENIFTAKHKIAVKTLCFA